MTPAGGVGAGLERGRRDANEIASESAEIVRELRLLARSEADLAKAELGEQLDGAKRLAIWSAIGSVLGVLALIFVPVTLMLVFDMFMPLWLAALLTTLVLGLTAAGLGLMAKAEYERLTIVPRRTINSLKEDALWARDQLISIVR